MAISMNELLLKGLNAGITDINDDGTVNVNKTNSDGSTVKMRIDPKVAAAKVAEMQGMQNVDVSQMPLTSENAPMQDSGLSFGQQVAFIRAKSKTDQLGYLRDEFGSDNVKVVNGQPVIKGEDGQWKLGSQSSGWKGVAANLTEGIAPGLGAVAGGGLASTAAIAGLGLASLTGVGALAIAGSAIVGAGLGAAVGKATDIGAAHALGIRNELDASEVAKELGHEFLLGAAGETVGLGLQMTPALFGKAMNKIKSTVIDNPRLQKTWADLLSGTYGVTRPTVDISMQEGKEMIKQVADNVQFSQDLVSGKVAGGLSPAEVRASSIMENQIYQPFKAAAEEQYGTQLAGAQKALGSKTISIFDEAARWIREMQAEGLMDKTGRFLADKELGPNSDLAKAAALREFNNKVMSNVMNATKGEITLPQLMNLERRAAEFAKVEASKAGGQTSAAADRLREFMGGFKSNIDKQLIDKGGDGLRSFVDFRGKYSNYLDQLDTLKAGLRPDQAASSLTRMFAAKESGGLQQSLLSMGKVLGKEEEATAALKALQVQYGAAEIAGKVFNKAGGNDLSTMFGSAKALLFNPQTSLVKAAQLGRGSGEKMLGEAVFTPTLGASTNPFSQLLRPIDQSVLQVWDTAQGRSKQPIDQSRVVELSTMGKAATAFNKLDPKFRDKLMQTPQLMQQLVQPMMEARQMYQQMQSQLRQQTAKAIKGRK